MTGTGQEDDLTGKIGMLRIAMRLLTEEEESLSDPMNRILIDLAKERQQVRNPWTVNVANPQGHLKKMMEQDGIEPGMAKAEQGYLEAKRSWLKDERTYASRDKLPGTDRTTTSWP